MFLEFGQPSSHGFPVYIFQWFVTSRQIIGFSKVRAFWKAKTQVLKFLKIPHGRRLLWRKGQAEGALFAHGWAHIFRRRQSLAEAQGHLSPSGAAKVFSAPR